MTRKSLTLAALALLLSSGAAFAEEKFTEQQCEKVWSPEAWAQTKEKVAPPNYTCVPITNALLVNLEGATRAQVIKAMKAKGRPMENDTRLNFFSIPDGYVNFGFENDKVVRIFGWTVGDGQFIINLSEYWMCSDLPGSYYDRCNKKNGGKQ